ncbi:methylated-DNA--[protein]-cysteine S-methyltransferase [Paraburkholderia sp. J67]|uniref:methylated-DNA--[protein]-cysteine S-methyltransferase n=1 Tax=Paraburkholderia sp. J67 TaxID=2805435 RepID=UPI002ABDA158|nr:methylated-DNA--[protein]-cysteine S-methyltransferase [Paraburkholderia sp. J67]
MQALEFKLERVATPLGQMLILTDAQDTLRALDWSDYEPRMHGLLRTQYRGYEVVLEENHRPSPASHAMQHYFDGDIAAIDTLACSTGGTAFQREVWAALRSIAQGSTISYTLLAQRIGRPSSVRAVGHANGANPIGIVVPCHRVVGSDGSLTGYGGGLDRKRWLLEHERRNGAHAEV